MAFARFEALLKHKMGLDAVSIGAASVERAVRQRMAACAVDDTQTYWERVCGGDAELQELIEAVVVGETWFFRDREAFVLLARLAREEWAKRPADGVFRVLSLPCSTGEEPYSMAMALSDAGLPAERFHIDAVDISARAIAYAARGIYGRNSFRGQDLGFRDRHFDSHEQRYRVRETVRRQVRFSHGNLLESGWLPGAHAYDAIFCRNVLIYFDRATQERALEVLRRLLLPAGMLFVGPSETALLLDHGFAAAPVPRSFAFRKPDTGAAGSVRPHLPRRLPARHPAQPLSPAGTVKHVVPVAAAPRAAVPVAPAASTLPGITRAAAAVAPAAATASTTAESAPRQAAPHWIEEARKLANEGNLHEAMRYCERHLNEQPASVEGFYLVGLLHDAARNPRQAADYYRKALYLDPRHHEALVHLAVVLENSGDRPGAQRLFERAKRVNGDAR